MTTEVTTTATEEGPDTAAAGMTVEELRAHTLRLAGELPGTLRRITVRAGALSVDVEWENTPVPPASAAPAAPAAPAAAAAAPVETDTAPADLVRVSAPLVGTYYQASSPGAEPFVKVGDTVEAGQQLAIIEAMKLLNSITAEVKGTVHAIHVQDGDVVEYAQPLIDLVPAG
ncbi:hypothetical protein GCM10022403_012590 [Streptomyces coacervatus]|uniref:Biotin carboxyl carrier protein of acetyl-CoA carboxylase n=1 Tax=Streptomyces coacervatus TaxID=647381 RepID=A0ABP7GYR6_9ACTN|nr:biotin/lipoyl-containing protein [Streptomyces coacervatus]MDF2268165.1 acetyl-CoA carboxylase, biotin carboxyl carrier protein [Streptomyces coacervatus]